MKVFIQMHFVLQIWHWIQKRFNVENRLITETVTLYPTEVLNPLVAGHVIKVPRCTVRA